MKTIVEIYEEYRIMQNLQDHMLRVASVASLICNNVEVEIDTESIVKACLLHDMGNMVKFQLERFPEYNEPEGLAYWQKVQKEFWAKYGTDDHDANMHIVKEIGVSDRTLGLVDGVRFNMYCQLKESDDLSQKIVVYADARVNPFGVVSYEERMAESKERYKNKPDVVGPNLWDEMHSCGLEVESQIFSKCKIKPEDINDESVAPIIEELKKFVLK